MNVVCTPSRLPLFPLPPTSLEDQSKLRTATATPFLKRRVGDRPLWARGAPRITSMQPSCEVQEAYSEWFEGCLP